MVLYELRRGFRSGRFWISFWANLVMLAVGGWDYIQAFIYQETAPGSGVEKFLMSYSMGITSLIALFFPITSVMAYSVAYRSEKDSGYRFYQKIREGELEYRISRVLTAAILGFVATIVPCLVWLNVCLFVFKSGNTTFPLIYGIQFLKDLYRSNQISYAMILCANAGIQGLVFSVLGLGLCSSVKNKYFAALVPFLGCIIGAVLLQSICPSLNALYLWDPNSYTGKTFGIYIYDAVLVVLGIALFYVGEDKQ
ncbi:MAG: hypothetical protein MJ123_07615 [Lachnospiraceae bacterium]|nr:hypothetical protein [Lachnospiraceae bacterium]